MDFEPATPPSSMNSVPSFRMLDALKNKRKVESASDEKEEESDEDEECKIIFDDE